MRRTFALLWMLLVLISLGLCSATLTAGPNVWTSIGPYGGWVRALAVDPKSPATVYAGGPFGSGIFKTTDGGKNWILAGSGLTRPYVNVLAIDPQNPSTVYAGIDYGGVFKSTDGGTSWSASSSGLPQYPPSVVTLAIDPQNPATVYAGVHGDRAGIFKSTNGGASWNPTGAALEIGNAVSILAIEPSNSGTLYAGTYFGLWKSTDSGESWIKVNSDLVFGFVSGLVIGAQNTSTAYAGIFHRGVFKSTDGGITWISTGLPLADGPVAIDPRDPNILYAASGGVIFKSTDAGASWNAGPELGIVGRTFIFALAVDPLNPSAVYAATQSEGVFKIRMGERIGARPTPGWQRQVLISWRLTRKTGARSTRVPILDCSRPQTTVRTGVQEAREYRAGLPTWLSTRKTRAPCTLGRSGTPTSGCPVRSSRAPMGEQFGGR